MTERGCCEAVKKALYDCADIIQVADLKDRLMLAQAVETLSRSLEILHSIKEEGVRE